MGVGDRVRRLRAGRVFSYLKDWLMGATIVCLFGVTVG
jgi:hypothetical protein